MEGKEVPLALDKSEGGNSTTDVFPLHIVGLQHLAIKGQQVDIQPYDSLRLVARQASALVLQFLEQGMDSGGREGSGKPCQLVTERGVEPAAYCFRFHQFAKKDVRKCLAQRFARRRQLCMPVRVGPHAKQTTMSVFHIYCIHAANV